MDFAPSAYYGNGDPAANVSTSEAHSKRLAPRQSHARSDGFGDGYVNPFGQAWDSDWHVKYNDFGEIENIAYKRRYCKGCGAIIRRGDGGLLICSNAECARVFTGGYDDWPILVRYIWSK